MKTLILSLLLFALVINGFADNEQSSSISTNQAAEVKQKLTAFETGITTLKELTESNIEENCQQLRDYYLTHSNTISTKAKLPISRCFAASDEFDQAAQLAAEYVKVYSNDWHGWKILGGANLLMKKINLAIEPLTKAAYLGDDDSYAPLAFAALNLDRLDIVQDLVPKLLTLKNQNPPPEGGPLDIVKILVLYSLKADQPDIFLKALDGVSPRQIISREDLLQLVKSGCERFKGEGIEKISHKLQSATNITNILSNLFIDFALSGNTTSTPLHK